MTESRGGAGEEARASRGAAGADGDHSRGSDGLRERHGSDDAGGGQPARAAVEPLQPLRALGHLGALPLQARLSAVQGVDVAGGAWTWFC